MKKKKLEVGQIWQVSKTLDVRIIVKLREDRKVLRYISAFELVYEISLDQFTSVEHIEIFRAFRSWITRKKAVLIGHYDFKKKRAVKA